MAPRDTPKATPKKKTVVGKENSAKVRTSSVTVKKTMSSAKKPAEKISIRATIVDSRRRTSTVPKVSTPKIKENKAVPMPGSVTKSVKKATWKRRPKPAHSGVPVPEKMKKLLQKQLMDLEADDGLGCSLGLSNN